MDSKEVAQMPIDEAAKSENNQSAANALEPPVEKDSEAPSDLFSQDKPTHDEPKASPK